MNGNKDFRRWFALAVLILGTLCTILALSTDHWYDAKMVKEGYPEENIPGINLHGYDGLWKVCVSVKTPPPPGISHGFRLSKCFNVNDWKGLKNYWIKLTEAYSDANEFQNTYSNTYENTRFDNIVEQWSDSGDLDENIRTMLYPDYLKGIQAMEILALISGVTAIGVWMAYIAMSTRTRKGMACTVFKIITIVLVILTAIFHAIGVLVWLIKKNKEMSDAVTQPGVRRLLDGIDLDIYFGWSWGMAVAAAVLHLLSITPLALTKTNQTDDMTKRKKSVPPSGTTPQN